MKNVLITVCVILVVAALLCCCLEWTDGDTSWADDWSDWPEIPRNEREG